MGLLAAWVDVFANIAQIFLLLLGMFLILVVLLQRGRGGGLAGAFGGAGGQSAFGTKAGDVFTKITIGIAVLWVITNGVSGMLIRASQSAISESFLPGGDGDNAGPGVSGTGNQSPIVEADSLDAVPDAGANTPDSLEIPETEIDPADVDAPDDGEAVAPETGEAATEDAGADEATESTDVPSTDSDEETATPPESSGEAADDTTESGDAADNPPN